MQNLYYFIPNTCGSGDGHSSRGKLSITIGGKKSIGFLSYIHFNWNHNHNLGHIMY